MPGQRLKCYCGNCPACLRLMEAREKRAAKYGCNCGIADCGCERWDETFDANHGHEMRDYYGSSTIRSAGSSLGGVVGLDFDGAGLGDGVATCPTSERWKSVMGREARAGVERRELRHAA